MDKQSEVGGELKHWVSTVAGYKPWKHTAGCAGARGWECEDRSKGQECEEGIYKWCGDNKHTVNS